MKIKISDELYEKIKTIAKMLDLDVDDIVSEILENQINFYSQYINKRNDLDEFIKDRGIKDKVDIIYKKKIDKINNKIVKI